jgi:hypothetical protein
MGALVLGAQQHARRDSNPQPSDPKISKPRPWASTGVHTARNDGPCSPPASTAALSSPRRMAPNLAPGALAPKRFHHRAPLLRRPHTLGGTCGWGVDRLPDELDGDRFGAVILAS